MKGIGMHSAMLCLVTDLTLLHTVSQTVKEVLQSLVDDGLVQADKIGSSNCAYLHSSGLFYVDYVRIYAVFWSFPSQRGAMVSLEHAYTRPERSPGNLLDAKPSERSQGKPRNPRKAVERDASSR